MYLLPRSDYIAHLDGFTEIPGGWLNHNWIQLAYQLADCVAGFSYSFVLTCVILFLMNLVPGLSLRVSAEEEEMGLDDSQMGEFAYDYVELSRHVNELLGSPSDEEVAGAGAGSASSRPSSSPHASLKGHPVESTTTSQAVGEKSG